MRIMNPFVHLVARMPARVQTKRRWRFRPKGAPKNLKAFVAEPA